MLIDATHQEEVRVAVVDGKRLVEFDYESKVRKQIKGGVFLAKVTRIEPSLQAAFVNYGGNRHGFLPFSEIHPDYFRIPVSDREALIAAQKAELEKHDIIDDEDETDSPEVEKADENDDAEDEEDEVVEVGGADKPADEEDEDLVKKASKKKSAKKSAKKKTTKKEEAKEAEKTDEEEAPIGNSKSDVVEKSDEELDAEAQEKLEALTQDQDNNNKGQRKHHNKNRGRGRNNRGGRNNRSAMRQGKSAELVGEEGEGSDKPFRFNLRHKYKIQEVLKRGQIMLIQVSKEERGNKGAAVTTYISLPGRYCVLMPNSPRGGGVSRKIGNFKDRKRMREILKDLTIPEGMSVILRTAGVSRTKAEIKRDLDYLTRLWNTIREDTLKASAPALINEEGNLIKRSIRDLYTRDIESVYVSGDKGYKTAKEFMKMLVPSHAKKVVEYDDAKVPLFHKYNVEKQITEIGEIQVGLKSGGSLVINPTEALVSIDVNSGRATKERHIEETALKTNLEAAEEVARQLRLRDLGGLVVIDFIDMTERRNNRKVENKLRDALSDDRARIQVGRISSFGLLELSRQRLNPSLTEAQFETCPECDGRGSVKTLDFAAITAMRSLEEEGIKGNIQEVSLNVPNNVAVYILNHKREMLADIEARYDFRVHIRVNEELKASEFNIEILAQTPGKKQNKPQHNNKAQNQSNANNNNNNSAEDGDDENDDKQKRGRRRGRRGGRRRHNKNEENNPQQNDDAQQSNADSTDKPVEAAVEKPSEVASEDKKPARKSSKKSASKKSASSSKEEKVDAKPEVKEEKSEKSSATKKKAAKKSTKKASSKTAPSNDVASAPAEEKKDYEVVNATPDKKKKGWWNKLVE